MCQNVSDGRGLMKLMGFSEHESHVHNYEFKLIQSVKATAECA